MIRDHIDARARTHTHDSYYTLRTRTNVSGVTKIDLSGYSPVDLYLLTCLILVFCLLIARSNRIGTADASIVVVVDILVLICCRLRE